MPSAYITKFVRGSNEIVKTCDIFLSVFGGMLILCKILWGCFQNNMLNCQHYVFVNASRYPPGIAGIFFYALH